MNTFAVYSCKYFVYGAYRFALNATNIGLVRLIFAIVTE
jgi:hypothetical protein